MTLSILLALSSNSLFSYTIEIAKTPQEIKQGLMGRASLDNDEAMLFILTTKQRISLWMYRVLFDIDVAFLDDDFTILEIKSMKAFPAIKDPDFFRKKAIRSSHHVKYALEAKKGFFTEHGLNIGSRIDDLLNESYSLQNP